jgi:hypothetical protein
MHQEMEEQDIAKGKSSVNDSVDISFEEVQQHRPQMENQYNDDGGELDEISCR